MTRTRLGVLGLCAMVLGLMAISASGAQASTWLILNAKKEVKTTLKALLKGELESGSTAVLLTTILGIKTEILCSAAELIGVNLEAAGAVTNGGKVKFTGCDVKLNGTLNKECEAHSNGSPVGTIETLAGKGQLALVLANGVGGTILEPQTGTTFVVVEMGLGCPIGNKVPIEGKLVLEDCSSLTAEKKCIDELATHLVTHGIVENKVHSTLTALKNSAKIDGRAFVSLINTGTEESGKHLGLAWSGDKE